MGKKLNYLLDKQIKIKLFGLFILIVIGSLMELVGVAVVFPIVDLVMASDYTESIWCKVVMNITGLTNRESIMIVLIGFAIGVYIFKSIYISWMQSRLYKMSADVKMSLSVKLMKSYMNQPYAFFLSKNSSELIRSVNQDTAQLYEVVVNVLMVSSNALTSIFLLVTLAVTNPIMTLVVAALMGVCAAIIMLVLKKKTRYFGKRNQELSASLFKSLQQMIEGVKEIKIIRCEDYYINQYSEDYKENTDIFRKYNLSNVIPKQLIECVSMSGILVYLGFQIVFNPNYMEIVPGIAVFVAAAYKLLPSVNAIYQYLNTIIYNRASIDLLYKEIKEASELSIKEYVEEETEKEIEFNNTIELDNVTFKYSNSDKLILDNVSIKIPKGKSVAFVGPSGGGKTTLADIVIGLLRPTSGAVKVDGENIIDNMVSWRKQIGYIPQSIFLTDDTLKNNVALGLSEDKIQEEKIWQALEDAQIVDFVKENKKGLNIDVGERGARISGGQRQRLGIARALYRDPEVLVFDEATSALDNETEKEVMKAIESLQGTRTMIMIAHRLTTIEKCDIIYKVENGKVTQISHDELFGK